MIKLNKALMSWKTPEFKDTLKSEIEQLAGLLPLQQGLSRGSYAINENVSIIILDTSEAADVIRAKVGIMYTSLVPGCNCADDPSPDETYNEYCEALFEINKITADTTITLVTE